MPIERLSLNLVIYHEPSPPMTLPCTWPCLGPGISDARSQTWPGTAASPPTRAQATGPRGDEQELAPPHTW